MSAEDCQKPKEYWYVSSDGKVYAMRGEREYIITCRKSIGDYFETREEAEKAREKARAWTRLKDKGFRFSQWTISEEPKTPHIKLTLEAEMDVPDSPYDLDLLFGGEE